VTGTKRTYSKIFQEKEEGRNPAIDNSVSEGGGALPRKKRIKKRKERRGVRSATRDRRVYKRERVASVNGELSSSRGNKQGKIGCQREAKTSNNPFKVGNLSHNNTIIVK